MKINIFYLDHDPKICSSHHFDKHVNVMIKESTQMLSTAVWCTTPLFAEDLYKQNLIYLPTHINHPSNKWVRKSIDNFIWLKNLTIWLNEEKKIRFNSGNHKSMEICLSLPIPDIQKTKFTQPPQCMPEYLHSNDSVISYRNYYMTEKSYLAKWTNREKPGWYNVDNRNIEKSNKRSKKK